MIRRKQIARIARIAKKSPELKTRGFTAVVANIVEAVK